MVLGAQFGDEGKGKIADYLAGGYPIVVRSGGGPNTGHTIHLPQGPVVLHQIACGILRPSTRAVSGPGMVVNPISLRKEIDDLTARGLAKGELVLSDRAHVILPIHELEDAWEEGLRAAKRPDGGLGTTRRGIGPAYSDRYGRWGIRFADLSHPKELRERVELLYERKKHIPGLPPLDSVLDPLVEAGEHLAPFIRPTEPILWEALERGEPILIEGAQSALLDVDFGTYPFVSSSHPTSAGALAGSGIPPQELESAIGVAKAYSTRVGAGPFPTEESGDMGEYLRREGGERGATTGRARRCGWLDLVLLRYASRLNGFTGLAITKVDVLGGLEEVPVCTHYVTADGTTIWNAPPTGPGELERITPVFHRFPGWPRFDERLRARIHRDGGRALPRTLQVYLAAIQDATRVPVRIVSYGPGRGETIEVTLPASAALGGLSGWSM